MNYPVKGKFRITQKFGEVLILDGKDIYDQMGMVGHNGLDLVPDQDKNIYAPEDGIIIEASFDKDGYGNYVRIETTTGFHVLAHMDSLLVKVGFHVKQGDKIGIVGSTGLSTGIHLHWGWRPKPFNYNNGYKGYENQLPLLINMETQPRPIYKIGDVLEPMLDIPVGQVPTKEDFSYGKIGVGYPAKIIQIVRSKVSGELYYDVDQTAIGGGTGFVKVTTVDETEMKQVGQVLPEAVKIEPKVPEETVVTSPEPPESKFYTEADMEVLRKQLADAILERDESIKALEICRGERLELQNKISAFEAFGYDNVEAVNKAIEKKDNEIIGVNKQLKQVTDRNGELLGLLQKKEVEDSTAIDKGIDALELAIKLQKDLAAVAKATGAKVEVKQILDQIHAIQKTSQEAIALGLKDVDKIKSGVKLVKVVFDDLRVKNSTNQIKFSDWLQSLLGLKGEIKSEQQ